jgi:hypothetical protein
MKRPLVLCLIIVIVVLPVFVAVACDGGTAKFNVNSTADAVDANPGDTVADDGSGSSTLRAAIMEANALAGADTIRLPSGIYVLTIVGANEDAAQTGDLDITDDLIIRGEGADKTIIDGRSLDRVFTILPGSTVDITGVTVRNGNPGPRRLGGGIDNRGTLTLTDSTVTGNSAASGGGGIANDKEGTVTLTDSEVSGNSAPDNADIWNRGTVAQNIPVDG